MSVTRNILVKTAISHLARYSFLVSSDVCTEDDNDGSEVFESHDISLPDTLHTFLSQYLSALSALSSRQNSSRKKKENSGERSRGSAPATSMRREIRVPIEYSYRFPVATDNTRCFDTIFAENIVEHIVKRADWERSNTVRFCCQETDADQKSVRCVGETRGINPRTANFHGSEQSAFCKSLKQLHQPTRFARVTRAIDIARFNSFGSRRASPRVNYEVQWKDRRERAITWSSRNRI